MTRDPGAAAALEQLLCAVRERDGDAARRALAADGALARASAHAAAAAGDVAALARLLADRTAAATERDAAQWPPLLYACASDIHPPGAPGRAGVLAAARLLLDHGANADTAVSVPLDDGEAPLSALYFACVSDHPELVELLLARGANPDDGESVYHAAEDDRRACLERLHAHGAELSAAHPRWRNTPLYFLAGHRDGDAQAATAAAGMRWLLEHGADPDVPSGNVRETPLHRIVVHRSGTELLALLCAHRADPLRARADGRTPYDLALRLGREDAAAWLVAHGADPAAARPGDRLLGACMRGDEAAARSLLDADPALAKRWSDEDADVLVHAAREGRAGALERLVAAGLDPSIEDPGGGTALHWAAWLGRPEAVRALIALGASLDARDRLFGSSPLGWACHGSRHCRADDPRYLEIVDALMDAGADPDAATNRWGHPAVDLASAAVARRLAERGFAPRP